MVGRKSGKSPLAAAILAYVLFEDGEPFAEISGVAGDFEQACYVFDHARGMIEQNPKLAERVQIYKGQQRGIRLLADESMYKVMSAEKRGKHGGNTHLLIVDELHVINDREYLDALETGTGSRLQPITLMMTTSDFERPDSICNDEHEYATQVRDGVVKDARYLPCIYEAHRNDDYTSTRTWRKANPTYPVTPTHEYLETKCKLAEERPSFLNTFKRLHLNIRTETATRWLPMDKWNEKCGGSIDLKELEGKPCFAGLDLASKYDLTAFVLLFHVEQRIKLVPYFWVPQSIATTREKANRPMLQDWIKAGLIKATDGDVTDYEVVRADINALGERFAFEIGVDLSYNGGWLPPKLQEDGFTITGIGQGFPSLCEPTLELETLVIDGRLSHGDNEVLRWMASVVGVETDSGGRMRPTKTSERGKIDGIVCAIMALKLAMAAGTIVKPGIAFA
jgi:phage terminase large subunit-like protein